MQNEKLYDIKACLKDIEQSIIEINDFLPEKSDFLEFTNDRFFFVISTKEKSACSKRFLLAHSSK